MSEAAPETPQEPLTPEEEPAQVPTPEEPGEAEEGEEEPTEPTEEPAEQEQPSGAAHDLKAAQRQRDQLDREDMRHRERLSAILGEDANKLLQCPMCAHFFSGWLPPPAELPLPPENEQLIRAFLGMPDLSNFHDDPAHDTCPDCDGLGRVRTGSKVPGYEVMDCGRCVGKGWVGKALTAENGAQVTTTGVTGPTVYREPEPLEDDPAVRSLRERGFLVVPPTNTGAGT
jgi:rubrerythrin